MRLSPVGGEEGAPPHDTRPDLPRVLGPDQARPDVIVPDVDLSGADGADLTLSTRPDVDRPEVNPRGRHVRLPDVTAAVAPDERLMRELYEDHAGVLLGYVRRLVGGDTARAEDVVQETLLRAWKNPTALDPERPGGASPRAWLLTVARRLVIDGERARQARPREVAQVDGTAAPPMARTTASADEELDRVLLAHGMSEALANLSADHRAVLDQIYFRDRSVAEAARELGVPEGTVKSRAYYALRALRVACEERGIAP